MLLIFTAPHFYVSSYKNSIFRSCTKSISVFDLLGDGISILVAQSVTVFIIEGISQKTYGLLINFYRQKPSFWPHFQPLSQILALFGCFLLWTTYTFLKIQTVSHQNLTFIQSDGLTCDFQIFYTEMSVKCVSQLEYCPTRTFSGKCMEKSRKITKNLDFFVPKMLSFWLQFTFKTQFLVQQSHFMGYTNVTWDFLRF